MTRRQAGFLLVKCALTSAILWWLFGKVDAPRVWKTVSEANLPLVMAGVGVSWLTLPVAGWRWHRLVAMFGIEVPLWMLTCIVQIGQFFMLFLPGSAGDDFTRALYVSRLANGRVGEACFSVLIDRCIGLTSILVLAVFAVPWQWHLLSSARPTCYMAFGIVAVGLITCAFWALYFILDAKSFRSLSQLILGALPLGRLRSRIAGMVGILSGHKRAVAQVLAAALGTQLLLCVLFYLGGLAVGIVAPLLTWLSFVPIVIAASAVPITIAGLGVREYLLVLFLGVVVRVDNERALAASLVVFSMSLATCLLGGIFYVFFRPRRNATPE